MQPEVSIITPLYNAESFIRVTAESVKNQTFTNFEWIIVDDCSTDSSREILKELSAQDSRIRIFYLPENMGPVRARNHGLTEAHGRFIAFLDSDDLWMPEKLDKQVRFMKESGVPLSYTSYKKLKWDGTPKTGIRIPIPKEISYHKLLHSNDIMASSAMYDTNMTGRIYQSTEVPIGKDDLYFFLGILKECGCAVGLREELACLRMHKGSITADKLRFALMQWKFLRNHMHLPFFSTLEKYTVYAVKGFFKYLL